MPVHFSETDPAPVHHCHPVVHLPAVLEPFQLTVMFEAPAEVRVLMRLAVAGRAELYDQVMLLADLPVCPAEDVMDLRGSIHPADLTPVFLESSLVFLHLELPAEIHQQPRPMTSKIRARTTSAESCPPSPIA